MPHVVPEEETNVVVPHAAVARSQDPFLGELEFQEQEAIGHELQSSSKGLRALGVGNAERLGGYFKAHRVAVVHGPALVGRIVALRLREIRDLGEPLGGP